jgi:hypothetical protein
VVMTLHEIAVNPHTLVGVGCARCIRRSLIPAETLNALSRSKAHVFVRNL